MTASSFSVTVKWDLSVPQSASVVKRLRKKAFACGKALLESSSEFAQAKKFSWKASYLMSYNEASKELPVHAHLNIERGEKEVPVSASVRPVMHIAAVAQPLLDSQSVFDEIDAVEKSSLEHGSILDKMPAVMQPALEHCSGLGKIAAVAQPSLKHGSILDEIPPVMQPALEHGSGLGKIAAVAQPSLKHGSCLDRKSKRKQAQKVLEQKPFKCLQCPKSYSSKVCLKSHMGVHLKKHICGHCDQKFSRRDVLRSHQWRHLPKEARKAAQEESGRLRVFPNLCRELKKENGEIVLFV